MLLTLFNRPASAQLLYMPRNIKLAIQKGTRSLSGLPGLNYWQNRGKYNISIMVQPPSREIFGQETITYYNNSPDTLKHLVLRLILNVHKPEALRYMDVDSNWFTQGTIVDRVQVNGKEVNFENPKYHFTWQNLFLPTPLYPHDSVQLTIDWHFTLARSHGREGVIDSTTFYLAYFYPRIAVYDDYNGWDRLDFTGYQEFYNDFNDYQLQVKVPRDFVVWATGTLLNPDGVLQPAIVERLRQSEISDTVVHIATLDDMLQHRVTSNREWNVWQWVAHDVSDVAVAISDHDVWDGASVVVDSTTMRRVSVQAAYQDTAADFRRAVAIGCYTLSWYSRFWPGIPYPYPKMTVVQGFADMEYPMMVNDASTRNLAFSQLVENHEIGHTYFPFYMGTHESRYAFMDEGWATTLEWLIGQVERGKAAADSFYKQFRITRWIHDPSQEEDLPIITPANVLRGVAYGNNAYGKPSLAYIALKDMLGDSLFRKCLHAYMQRWHGKHPTPWDFFYTFNQVSGKNLNPFWKSWFFSNGYDDLGIEQVQKTSRGYTLIIQNHGGFMMPFDLVIQYPQHRDTIHYTAAVWLSQPNRYVIHLSSKTPIQSIFLDPGIFMDANMNDNSWHAKTTPHGSD
ncbi:MAG: M1 family metallopeptidase [Thermoflavifilum sp.]|nr:M1 family metallopeptidase [Thermoflavifilum sp.]